VSTMPITRRQATCLLLASAGLPLSSGAAPSGESGDAGITELRLPPEVLAQLEHSAQSVFEEARWLEELPLEGLTPGFVFIPH